MKLGMNITLLQIPAISKNNTANTEQQGWQPHYCHLISSIEMTYGNRLSKHTSVGM